MKTLSLVIIALFFTAIASNAQTILKGVITESGKNSRLGNVFIRDVTNKQVTISDKAGNYSIHTGINHTLIFALPGYTSDTLYVVDMKPKNIELKIRGLSLNAVDVTGRTGRFDPEAEYPEVYRKSKFALSPSRIFGKESRDARKLKKYFANEVEQQQIDSVFTKALVSSIVPLKGQQLDNFMTMYRPSLDVAKNSSPQTLTIYINDSYRKFMALPADKRNMQSLQ